MANRYYRRRSYRPNLAKVRGGWREEWKWKDAKGQWRRRVTWGDGSAGW